MPRIAEEVTEKHWPSEVDDRLHDSDEAFLLVIDRDWAEFFPPESNFALIWLSELQDAESVAPLLRRLASTARRGGDVIQAVKDSARQAQVMAVAKGAVDTTRYFELKPGIFGVSVDVGALLRDLAAGNAG